MMSSLVSRKAIGAKRARADGLVDLRPRKAETALERRSPKAAAARRAPPRRPSTEPGYAPPIDADLEILLRSHAIQASMIANATAVSMGRWLAVIDHPDCSNPRAALEIVHDYERVRRSATEDLRRTTALIQDLHRPPMMVAAKVTDGRAEVAIGHAPARLSAPPTEEQLANAYTEGAPAPRQLKEWRS